MKKVVQIVFAIIAIVAFLFALSAVGAFENGEMGVGTLMWRMLLGIVVSFASCIGVVAMQK